MEQRTWKRKPKSIPCIIEAPDYKNDERFECTTRDLSLSGVFISPNINTPEDRILELKFSSSVTNHHHYYSLFGYIVRNEESGCAFAIRRASKLSLYRLNEIINE
jgi:hypothetical protein